MNLIIKDYVLYIKDYLHVRSYLTKWYHKKQKQKKTTLFIMGIFSILLGLEEVEVKLT